MKRKPALVNILQAPLCPYWHYDCADGRVVIYIKDRYKLTAERGNWMLDMAKLALLKESEHQP